MTEEDVRKSWKILTEEILKRKEILKQYCEEQGLDYRQEDIAALTYNYMRERTSPYFIFCERFYDFCMLMTEDAKQILSTILTLLRQYNMYMIGCFLSGRCNEAVFKCCDEKLQPG